MKVGDVVRIAHDNSVVVVEEVFMHNTFSAYPIAYLYYKGSAFSPEDCSYEYHTSNIKEAT